MKLNIGSIYRIKGKEFPVIYIGIEPNREKLKYDGYACKFLHTFRYLPKDAENQAPIIGFVMSPKIFHKSRFKLESTMSVLYGRKI